MCERGSVVTPVRHAQSDIFHDISKLTIAEDEEHLLAGYNSECVVNSLHDAVRMCDVAAVERLLDEGHDPNEPDWTSSGEPPILQAASAGYLSIVR